MARTPGPVIPAGTAARACGALGRGSSFTTGRRALVGLPSSSIETPASEDLLVVLLAAACDGPALDLDAGAAREDLVDGLGRSTAQIVQQSVIGGDLGTERAGMLTGHGRDPGRGL